MEQSKPPAHHFKLILSMTLLVCVAVVSILVLGWVRKKGATEEAKTLQDDEAKGRTVEVAEVKPSSKERRVLLVGESRAYYSVTLYARVSGYLTELHADVGDVVKKGQLLAKVESPEAEQAYYSAKADAMNKKRIADRTRVLLKRKLVSQQEADQAFAASDIADATLKTQETIREYQNIVAPFDGKISDRFADPGALIQNASGNPGVQALFILAQTDQLRVFFYINQNDAPYIQVGDSVEISLPDRIETRRVAKLTRLSGELDAKTRTLLAELILDNPDGKIVAGSFLHVALQVRSPELMQVPSQALVMRNKETFVPVVEKNQVHYRKIDLADNDGMNIKVRSGIHLGEQVALNIGNTLQEGQPVHAVHQREAAGQAPDKEKQGQGRASGK